MARAQALRDAEAFDQILFALERLGSYLTRKQKDLGYYKDVLSKIAKESHLCSEAADRFPQYHLQFDVLYEEARVARNDAMHQGAAARHLARHAQELALAMEDALMNGARTAGDFMVPNPICAERWQPLSAVRRTMLVNAFSFLPFRSKASRWQLVSDQELVKFTRVAKEERDYRLLMTLEEALDDGLKAVDATTCAVSDPLPVVIEEMKERPCLVLSKDGALVGIITAFDLL
jgi:CBS domain-containing protein